MSKGMMRVLVLLVAFAFVIVACGLLAGCKPKPEEPTGGTTGPVMKGKGAVPPPKVEPTKEPPAPTESAAKAGEPKAGEPKATDTKGAPAGGKMGGMKGMGAPTKGAGGAGAPVKKGP